MREAAADDHFYGPWKGGPKGSGGRPAGGEAPATKVTNVVDPAFDFRGLTDQQLDALLPNAEYHAKYSRTGTPIGDRWQQVVRQTKAEQARRARRLQEAAADDHFYGPWKGSSKGSGGRPATGGRQALPGDTPDVHRPFSRPMEKRDGRWAPARAVFGSDVEAKRADPSLGAAVSRVRGEGGAVPWEPNPKGMELAMKATITGAGLPVQGEPGSIVSVKDRLGKVTHVYRDEKGMPVGFVSLENIGGVPQINSVGVVTKGKGYGTKMYDTLQDSGKVNLYDHIGRSNAFTAEGKKFAQGWLQHRLMVEGFVARGQLPLFAESRRQGSRKPIDDAWRHVRAAKVSADGMPSPEEGGSTLREAGDDHFYGPWKGDAKAAGGRPEKPSEARPEKPSLQTQAWQDPPPKEAGPGGVKKAGGYSSDEAYGTNTALGRAGEKSFVNVVGGEVLHAPGKGEQSPLDVKVGQYGFEVKAVSTRSTKYAATPKKYEVAQKEAYAKKMGLKPAMAIVVMDAKGGQAHVYYREGLRGGRLSKATGWKYLGSGDAAKIAEAFGFVEAGDDHFYGAWSGGSKAAGGKPMRAAGKDADVAGLSGPAARAIDEWGAKQDYDKDALEHGAVFSPSGKLLGDYAGQGAEETAKYGPPEKTSVNMTQAAVDGMLKGNIQVHTHPGESLPFSPEDVTGAMVWRPEATVVVSQTHIYTLRPGPKGWAGAGPDADKAFAWRKEGVVKTWNDAVNASLESGGSSSPDWMHRVGSAGAQAVADKYGLVYGSVPRASLREASEDDHFYGPWKGGSKAQGGHPMRASDADPTLALRDKVALELARGPQDHETCVAVRDGEEVFRKSGGGREVAFTQEEADLMKGAHVVHNHPSGTAPSVADYTMASRYADAASMTAIGTTVQGEKWKYTITRPPKGWDVGNEIVWPFHEERVHDRVAQKSWLVSAKEAQRLVSNERHEVWLEMAARYPSTILYSREAWS